MTDTRPMYLKIRFNSIFFQNANWPYIGYMAIALLPGFKGSFLITSYLEIEELRLAVCKMHISIHHDTVDPHELLYFGHP